MGKNLLIVESPAKAKTIEKLLGKDFTVKSSFGHIRDLAQDSKAKKAIDIENAYRPNYIISPEKRKVVKELKDWVKKVDTVWLATDEDREGEAISWHLAEVLGLNVYTTKRIVFREITKPALQKAVQTPRTIDLNLVNAQQARRILDRLIGYELSPLLWRKIRKDLSAGRVQSVAVKLVVERERNILQFDPEPFFKVAANFLVENERGKQVTVKAQLNTKLETYDQAKQFLERCQNAIYEITDIKVKPTYRKPAAPFTTSTLQQEASRKLGFSVSRTMSVAQGLYEAGLITYMRTDSTSLSEVAIQNIANAIVTNYGQPYLNTRQYKSKSANAQEAHEAIRPTYIEKQQAGKSRDEKRLYELIWKRTIASQMSNARLEKTTVDIAISTVQENKFVAVGEVLKFDGFLKVYLESKDEDEEDDDNDAILPPMKKGQNLPVKEINATERFTRSKPRFTEASLVKKLEELSIGRPSTYAPTIAKIMDPRRGYITRETRDGVERKYKVLTFDKASAAISEATKTEITGAEKNKLFASDIGMLVTDFLSEHFERIMNYSFTANIEDRLDDIAKGKELWSEMLDTIYKPFHKLVEETLEGAERVNKERILGKDPASGLTLLVRMSRFGPVAQIGTPEELGEDTKPKYANLKREQSLETITFEEALVLFQYPKVLGEYEGEELSINEGRYGPYIKWKGAYISIPKGTDILAVDYSFAVRLAEEKKAADAPVAHYEGEPITKGKGRFGPYVKWKKLFVSIPAKSGITLENVTADQAVELVKEKIKKEAERYIHQWEEYDVSVQNGRWGPFIKVGKKNFKLLNKEGKKMDKEAAAQVTFEQVKALVEDQGGVIKEPKKAKKKTTKKTTAKRKTTKKK